MTYRRLRRDNLNLREVEEALKKTYQRREISELQVRLATSGTYGMEHLLGLQ